ncbi:C1 family peptidase [Mycoplasma phocimorsus]|uniref:C1 family peptidase n=1 Tax=Mycoplasma phocimorsus TaxID=3045839 RepID=UPI0024BF2A19|nr:C1 family peptidase [Mycoplasma phocimorsus]MDJ1649055.1 C1 family peptidase [Mycoplasma phocimorsus]
MKITNNLIQKFIENYNSNPINKIVENAITKNGVYNSIYNNNVRVKHNNVFSTQVKKGGMTDQKNTGRCWIFAALNTLKVDTMKILNTDKFEFSQAYTMFWEKMEKANTFMDLILKFPKLEFQDRLFNRILEFGAADGGYWEWVESLISKYGVVPKSIMQETISSSSTTQMNEVLKWHLISSAKLLREAKSEKEIQDIRIASLEKVYEILSKCLGQPINVFDYEYRDKDDKFIRHTNLTPLTFLEKFCSPDYKNFVNLTADPRNRYPKNTLVKSSLFKTVNDKKALEYINVELNDLKISIINSLKDGQPVWFDCDMSPYIDKKAGIMDLDVFDINNSLSPFNILTKADRVNFSLSSPTHAMTFVGVDLDENNNVIKWEVENSWGEKIGEKGYFSMSDQWFDEYCFGAIINPKYVSSNILEALEKDPVEADLFDPM